LKHRAEFAIGSVAAGLPSGFDLGKVAIGNLRFCGQRALR
jgi:hypothetical protein